MMTSYDDKKKTCSIRQIIETKSDENRSKIIKNIRIKIELLIYTILYLSSLKIYRFIR